MTLVFKVGTFLQQFAGNSPEVLALAEHPVRAVNDAATLPLFLVIPHCPSSLKNISRSAQSVRQHSAVTRGPDAKHGRTRGSSSRCPNCSAVLPSHRENRTSDSYHRWPG